MKSGELNGAILLIDKPRDWSSFDVVKKLRWAAPKRKAGHAGTLDPLATGLLIVCTGDYTKKISGIQDLPKTYTGVIQFGATTPSYDAETPIESNPEVNEYSFENVMQHASAFTGLIEQIPPAYSAVLINGTRAYKLARRGEEVNPEPRKVTIYDFKLSCVQWPEVFFEVHCSKGTYIRSLAHDLGQAVGCGAYLKALRRTKIGDYSVEYALSPQEMNEKLNNDAGLSKS